MQLDVQLAEETVWLAQQQMAVLFDTTKQNVSLQINNIFKEGEIDKISVVKDYLTTAADGKKYRTTYYNLDVIISVGYRVKSKRGTQFRQWALKVIKDYMLRGYAINQQMLAMEERIDRQLHNHTEQIQDLQKKVNFFVRTSLPPHHGLTSCNVTRTITTESKSLTRGDTAVIIQTKTIESYNAKKN